MPGREAETRAVVVHRVVGGFAARQALAIERDHFAARDDRDPDAAVAIGELVGTLLPVDAEELHAIVFARRARERTDRMHSARGPVRAHALQPALETREHAVVEAQRKIAERRAALRRGELEPHLVHRLQLDRAAAGGHRRVAIGEHAGELHAGRERSAQCEIERLAQHGVLRRAELDRDRLVAVQRERRARGRRGGVRGDRARFHRRDRHRLALRRRGRMVAVALHLEWRRIQQPARLHPQRLARHDVAQQAQLSAHPIEAVVHAALERAVRSPDRIRTAAQESMRQREHRDVGARDQRHHAARGIGDLGRGAVRRRGGKREQQRERERRARAAPDAMRARHGVTRRARCRAAPAARSGAAADSRRLPRRAACRPERTRVRAAHGSRRA